jgi:hypothetical protein
MVIEQIESLPAGENPFNHDLTNMGQHVGTNCMVMFKNHPNDYCPYLIVLNPNTGERVKISFPV